MRRAFILAIAALLSMVGVVGAQQAGTSALRGRVVDEQQAVLPGVALIATNVESGVYRETVSGPDGTYFITGVNPGTYRITAELAGFSKMTKELKLDIGQTVTLDIPLQVASLSENVTVTAEAAQVDLTSAQVGGNISEDDMNSLPTISRGLGAFVGLIPGVQYTPSTLPTDSFSINGQATGQVQYVLDGGVNNDDRNGGSTSAQARPALESIQEFQVITNQFDAEYGKVVGGIVNAVTKSGSNLIKGSAFGYYSDSAWSARDFFAKQNDLPKPESGKRQGGFTVGGPIVKNRVHYFFSFERIIIDEARSHVFITRPDLNYTSTENSNFWNTLIRGDEQINANNTLSFRWLRDWQPNYRQTAATETQAGFRTELDNDQTMMGSYNRVIGQTKLNSLRLARTRENNNRGSDQFLTGKIKDHQELDVPRLQYLNYTDGPSDGATRRWQITHQIDDIFNWFVPGKLGDHDLKTGFSWVRASHRQVTQSTLQGTFSFPSDKPFNAADPSTYPERLSIRVPGQQLPFNHYTSYATFLQDKWRVTRNLTLNIGVRWDLDIVPIQEVNNPFFASPDKYPTDWNNVQPRLGFAYSIKDRAVVRGGYGTFYQRTLFQEFENLTQSGVYSDSFTANFPNDRVDPGPSAGRLPADPLLVNGPVVNHALVAQLYPEGSVQRNTATVLLDNPDRVAPNASQRTIGVSVELAKTISVAADFLHIANRDQYLAYDLNPGLKQDTGRTSPLTRTDLQGLAGKLGLSPFSNIVRIQENLGRSDSNALNLSVDRRHAGFWSARLSYSLSAGNSTGSTNPFQVGAERNLDLLLNPTSTPRHNLSVAGRIDVPVLRGMNVSGIFHATSGSRFTLQDTSVDANRNGLTPDPLPAGTYAGTGRNAISVDNAGGLNGAVGPGSKQLDMRIGYGLKLPNRRTLDFFTELFNITNTTNFNNPNGDRRLANFLVLTAAQVFPRSVQLGMRLAF